MTDEIFNNALNVLGIKRTKKMYHKATYPHVCSMCLDDKREDIGYALNQDFVEGFDTPYLYICKDCYNELEDK